MLAAFATDPGPPSELIHLSEHRSHVSRHRAILARPEPEFLRNALVAIRAVVAMIPEELRRAPRHCRAAHGWSSRRLSAASSIPPNNHTLWTGATGGEMTVPLEAVHPAATPALIFAESGTSFGPREAIRGSDGEEGAGEETRWLVVDPGGQRVGLSTLGNTTPTSLAALYNQLTPIPQIAQYGTNLSRPNVASINAARLLVPHYLAAWTRPVHRRAPIELLGRCRDRSCRCSLPSRVGCARPRYSTPRGTPVRGHRGGGLDDRRIRCPSLAVPRTNAAVACGASDAPRVTRASDWPPAVRNGRLCWGVLVPGRLYTPCSRRREWSGGVPRGLYGPRRPASFASSLGRRAVWCRSFRVHHRIHHRLPSTNFGVTTRFWDDIFGTMYRKPWRPTDGGECEPCRGDQATVGRRAPKDASRKR